MREIYKETTFPGTIFRGISTSDAGPVSEVRTIRYGIHTSPFGEYFLGMTGEGWIVALEFFDDQGILLETLRKDWMQSSFLHDPESTGGVASRLFSPGPMDPLYLLARGTLFQLKVWQALLEIPFGKTVTYEQLARRVNNPGGLQAVGNAIGKNPIAWVIPCHRVIRKSGKISKYRWGTQRKAAMLEWENPAAYKGIWSQAG